jgi:polynucleotide 5'-triphosphatase
MLNKRVEETLAREYQFAPVRYKHVVLIDEFYSGGGGSEKIRLTKDKNTGHIVESLAKRRVADLEITSPKRKVDWRISVNIEQPISVSSSPLCWHTE